MQTLTKIPTLADFEAAYQRFIESIIENAFELGKMLVDIVAHDPRAIDKLIEHGFSQSTLLKLYDIGNGKLDPRLLIDDSPASNVIRQLPLPQQKQYLDEGVKVVAVQGGKEVVRMKPVSLLTQKEVSKALLPSGAQRPIEDQRIMANREAKRKTTAPAERFKISDDGETIDVLEKTSFTLSQWVEIAERAGERQKEFLQSIMERKQIRGN
jgi:hypothetical protein